MLTTNDEFLQNFGNELKRLRKENNVTNRYIEKVTKIDNGTLSRLESGFIKKINPVVLKKLADFYNVNVLNFQLMLGYINKEDILKFSDTLKNQNSILKKEIDPQNLKIPIIKAKDILLGTTQKKFFNISNTNGELFAFSNSSDEYYIFKKTDTLNKDDIGLFEVNKKIYIARYAFEGNFVLISDILSSDIILKDKSDIVIIGRIFYTINVN